MVGFKRSKAYENNQVISKHLLEQQNVWEIPTISILYINIKLLQYSEKINMIYFIELSCLLI